MPYPEPLVLLDAVSPPSLGRERRPHTARALFPLQLAELGDALLRLLDVLEEFLPFLEVECAIAALVKLEREGRTPSGTAHAEEEQRRVLNAQRHARHERRLKQLIEGEESVAVCLHEGAGAGQGRRTRVEASKGLALPLRGRVVAHASARYRPGHGLSTDAMPGTGCGLRMTGPLRTCAA